MGTATTFFKISSDTIAEESEVEHVEGEGDMRRDAEIFLVPFDGGDTRLGSLSLIIFKVSSVRVGVAFSFGIVRCTFVHERFDSSCKRKRT